MGEASRDLAQGIIEVMVSESVCAKERMEAREVEEAYQKFEESEDHIKEMLDRGAISMDEARRLRTRGKMHQQEVVEDKPKISSAVLAGADHKTNEQIIELALKTKKRWWLIESLRKAFRLDKLQNRIQIEKHKRSLPEYVHRYPFTYSMVKTGMTFELFTFFLVACNGVLTGVQVSVKGTENDLPIFSAAEEFFNVVFILEIILRVMADGWVWFFATGNAVDIVLILVTGVFPSYILKPIFNVDSGELRIGQALRCVRLVRILKSVRTLSAFRILWSLVSGIIDSGRILLWTLMIITVVLYMFSVFFVQLLVWQEGIELNQQQIDLVKDQFYTVPETMFTLFQCLTLDSWTDLSRKLQTNQPFIGIMWVLYVAVACMVLNNLVIAVIVNNAFDRASKDEELQASIIRETTEAELNDLRTLFDELVTNPDSQYLTQEEYETAVNKNNEILWTKLKLNSLEEDEIRNLWSYMDWAESIDREEFASQIRNLKGECKAKHSYTVAMNLKKLDARLHQATAYLDTHKKICETLKKETTQAQLELSRSIFELRQFIILTQRCIPGGGIPATSATERKMGGFQAEVAKKVQPLLTPIMDLPDVDESFRQQLVQMRNSEGFSLPGEIDEPR